MSNSNPAMTVVRDKYGHTRYVPLQSIREQQESKKPTPKPLAPAKHQASRADTPRTWHKQSGNCANTSMKVTKAVEKAIRRH